MTAIFTGLGTGFANSSAATLGGAGTLGGAAIGRAGEGISVNAATGNLVVSRRDEFLTGRSLDVGISRTYNSLGTLHDGDNGDKWQMSTARRVFDAPASAALDTAGSTVKRLSGDGSAVTYTYGTKVIDGTSISAYWTTDGSGAHDRMWKSGGDWYWKDGSSQIDERYDADPHNAGQFRIIRQTDRDGQSLVFEYSGNKLSKVITNSSEYLRYNWSGDNIVSITSAHEDRNGVVVNETGTYYTYTNGRLSAVTIDLSPEVAGTADGDTFTISYAYDSAGRITQVSQSDGSATAIVYDASGRVSTLTEQVGDGTTRLTRLQYYNGYTMVTAPNGQKTKLDFNKVTGELDQIVAPPAFAGAAPQVQSFSYDIEGNLTSSTAPDGAVTQYSHDAMGNVTLIDRPIGTDVVSSYNVKNDVTKTLSYGSNEGSASTTAYVRYAYDSEGHMRYRVSADGHISEYRYDSYGRVTWELDYIDVSYPVGPSLITEAEITSWIAANQADKTQRAIKLNQYDARGNLKRIINYGGATAQGGASSVTADGGYSSTYFVYDQAGRLITRYNTGEGKEQFVYDGMGRMVASSDASGSVTSVFFDDANTTTVMQMSSGLTRTLVYNKSGDLVSELESSLGVHGSNVGGDLTNWAIARADRTAVANIAGKPAYKLNVPVAGSYGVTSRHQGVAAGETVRFRITLMGSGSQTLHKIGIHGTSEGWGTNTDGKTQAIIVDGPGKLVQDIGGRWTIDGISTTVATTVEIVRTFDVAQTARGYVYVGGTGQVAASTAVILSDPVLTKTVTDNALSISAETQNKFDKLGRLRVSQDMFDGRGPGYIIYDKAGRKIGVVDAVGGLTEYFYDKSNRLIGTTSYYTAVSTSVLALLADPDNQLEMVAANSLPGIRPAYNNTYDIREITTYDANGRVAQTINGEGEIISFEYDDSGRLIKTTNHFNKVTIYNSWRGNPPQSPVTAPAPHAQDAVTRTFYDRDGNVRGVLDGEGYLTETKYDQADRAVEQIAYGLKTNASYWVSGTFNQLRGSVQPNGTNKRVVRSVYDGAGRLRYQIDSANFVTAFSYNVASKLTQTRQHANPLATGHSDWSFTGVYSAVSANSAEDRYVTNYYDSAGRLYRTYDGSGLNTYFYFDDAGNVIKTVAGNRTTRAWHDARGNVRFSMDAEGYLTSYTYNEAGQLTRELRYEAKATANDATTIQNIVSQATGAAVGNAFSYNAAGWRYITYHGVSAANSDYVSQSVDAFTVQGKLAYSFRAYQSYDAADNQYNAEDQSKTYFLYDNAGRLIQQESADAETEQAVTKFTYDGLGNQTKVEDGNGHIVTFTYDQRGQVLTETNAEGETVTYEYNAFGEVTKTRDAKNVIASQHIYNALGQLISSQDALGNTTSYTYNRYGEVETVTDARGAVTTFAYDKLGRVTSTTDALGFVESYQYDAYSNRTRVYGKSETGNIAHGSNNITNYTYDRLGRVTKMVDANGYDTDYTYDARGNQIQVKREVVLNSNSSTWHTTDYVYDDASRLISTTTDMFTGHATETFTYDGRGNLTSKTAPDGGKTVYFYDDLDRVTAEINPAGTFTAYTYDKVGNVTNIKVYETPRAAPADGGSQEQAPTPTGVYRETGFIYDDANRMVQSWVKGVHNGTWNGTSWAANAANFNTFYEYDANGNVVKTTDPEGKATYAWYDELNRKEHQVDGEGYRTSWVYDAAGNVTRENRFGNKVTGTLSTGTHPSLSANATLDRRTDYTYDLMGNRLTEARLNVKIHNGNGGHITTSVGAGNDPKVEYTYNGLGQVLTKTEAVHNNVTQYTYDNGGRLTTETRAQFDNYSGQSVSPVVNYAYDGLGNLTSTTALGAINRVTTYAYTGGKLASMTDAEGTVRYYGYDAAGREDEVWVTRKNYYNASRNEGVSRTYDVMGRVVSEFQGIRAGNGTWTEISPVVTTAYNAFGDVASVQMGTASRQINNYDLAGRLWATNSGDGVWKFFGYDKNGNQTIALTSAGATWSGATTFQEAYDGIANANVNATYTVYDGRNQATRVIEEGRELAVGNTETLVTERFYNAFGEVAYELGARLSTEAASAAARIDYTYNTAGKVIKIESPAVSYRQENSNGTLAAQTTGRPTEHFYHDAGGRLVAQRDANGNLTRIEYLNGTGFDGSEGLVSKVIHADNSEKITLYDQHGDARRLISEDDGRSLLNRTIEQTFDKLGRITQTWNRGTNLQDNYTYDVNGQQLSHYRLDTGEDTAANTFNALYGTGNKEITDYDALGRVVSSRAFGGDTTITSYLWQQGTATDAVGDYGGWKKTTTVTGRAMTEWSDLFDRQVKKIDFGNHTFTFSHDAAGRLSGMSTNGGTQAYVYYNTGKLKSLANVTGVVDSNNFQELKTTYGYDKVGNLKSQVTTDRGATFYNFNWNDYEPDVYSNTWNRTTQNQTASYDALGRMTSWNEAGGADLPAASMSWTYDANGNIRRSQATYRRIFSDQSIATTNSTQDNWYRFDNMNRVVTSRGVLNTATNAIERGYQGLSIAYNENGSRAQVTTTSRGSSEIVWAPHYYAQPIHETAVYDYDTREDYIYNAAGQLKEVHAASGYFDQTRYINEKYNSYAYYNPNGPQFDPQDYVVSPSTPGAKRADYTYDALGRTLVQRDFQGSNVVFSRALSYNTEGQVSSEDSTTKKGTDSYRSVNNTYFNADNTVSYATTTNYKNGNNGDAPDTRTNNSYVWYDGAVQSSVSYDNDTGTSSNNPYTSSYSYNSFGVLQSAQINDGRTRSVSYINSAEGQVISRKEKDNKYDLGDPSQIYYRFGGKELGNVGNDGTSNVNYEQSILRRTEDTSDNFGAFTNGANTGVGYADFGGDYDAINSFAQGSGGGSYTVRGGESLQGIAAQLWGDSALWYKLAEANGLSGREPLIEGRSLVIPSGVQRTHHNAGTMKPYDPAEAIGDTSPTAAKQPKKSSKGCGVLGAILSAVVAVAASYVFGPIFGNVISQGFNNLIGTQSGFSWKSLGLSVVSAAVTAGVGSAFGSGAMLGSQFVGDVVRGAASSALTQGIGTATGLQDKFSWAGVAAAGIGAGVGGAVMRAMSGDKGFYGDGQRSVEVDGQTITPSKGSWQWNANDAGTGFVSAGFGATALSSAASSLANAATRSAIEGTSFGKNIVASIPDVVGQVVGGAIGQRAGSVWGDKDHDGVLGVLQDISEAPTKVGRTVGARLGSLVGSGVNDIGSLLKFGKTVGERELEEFLAYLDEAERTRTGPYATVQSEPEESHPDPEGTPLGPQDTFGRRYGRTELDIGRSLSPRNQRIDALIDDFRNGRLSDIMGQYFPMTTDSSITAAESLDRLHRTERAVLELLRTNTGRRIAIALAHKGTRARITLSDTADSAAVLNSDRVALNPLNAVADATDHFRGSLPSSPVRFTLTVILGHELGHAVLGYSDESYEPNALLALKNAGHIRFGQSDRQRLLRPGPNVRYVENPLRRELGLGPRPSYVSEQFLRRHFPEVFPTRQQSVPTGTGPTIVVTGSRPGP